MFVESNLGYEKNLLLISPPNGGPQAAEYALSNGPATCDLSSLSSDQQNQVAVVQALMDLNASPHISYHSTDTLPQQALTIEVPQKFERKSCNCTKSHCLKLYCECFARGQSCDGCNCSNCMNNYNFEDDRRRAIKSTLERNPLAFYPKIGSSMKKHSKGCNCKRSNCLKNYCECYEAKISCSDLCKCRGCRNFVKPPPHDAVPSVESTNFSQPCDRFFSACITPEVIEVACSCMLSQLYLANHHDMSETEQEHVVLLEFAKCLDHILDSVDKLRTAEYSGEKYGKAVSPLISSDVLRSADRGVACACPSCSSSEIPRPNPSDLAMPLPYALENSDDAYYSNTFQSVVSDDLSCVEYSNFFVSSDISEVPLTHYDPTPSSFQAVMSAGMGETSNLVEISDLSETMKGTTTEPTILIPYNLFSPNSSEVHSHLLPASSSPSPPLPPQTQLAYQLDQQSFLMSSSGGNVSGEDTICYPLTHSTEADLAAAAISAEVDPILVVSNPEDCDFEEDVDEGGDCGGVDCVGVGDDAFHPHGLDTAYYNLSNPFDLIPSEF